MPALDSQWRKSSRSSTNGSCVEIRRRADVVEMRDTKDRAGPVLAFPAASWRSFLDGVRAGRYDLPRPRSRLATASAHPWPGAGHAGPGAGP